jgi:uncharacterized protein YjbI with pentapeptide repeats
VLDGADLNRRLLNRADLNRASFEGAQLTGAQLAGAELRAANFTGAVLDSVNLIGAKLAGAHLRGVQSMRGTVLDSADLTRANLEGQDLTGVRLAGAVLRDALLTSTRLAGVSLVGADLIGADLTNADLTGADLTDAVLAGGGVAGASFSQSARLRGADLRGVVFEPRTIPDPKAMALALNLSALRYELAPGALIELRNAFEKGGFEDQGRRVRYAIGSARSERMGWFARMLDRAFFGVPVGYGLYSSRPLLLLGVLTLVAVFAYLGFARWSRESGLHLVRKGPSDAETEEKLSYRSGRILAYCSLFSVTGALQFVTINFLAGSVPLGVWIHQTFLPREIELRARGWARVVWGVHGALSLYLVGLWFWYTFTL